MDKKMEQQQCIEISSDSEVDECKAGKHLQSAGKQTKPRQSSRKKKRRKHFTHRKVRSKQSTHIQAKPKQSFDSFCQQVVNNLSGTVVIKDLNEKILKTEHYNVETVKGNCVYKCSDCKVDLLSKTLYLQHLQTHPKHQEDTATPDSPKHAKESVVTVTETKQGEPKKKVLCNFDSLATDHVKVVNGRTFYSCKLCMVDFPSRSVYNNHMFINHLNHLQHMQGKTVGSRKCKTCSKVFYSSSEYQKHFDLHGCLRQTDGNVPISRLCEVCGKNFDSASIGAFNSHVKSHFSPDIVVDCPYGIARAGSDVALQLGKPAQKYYACSECPATPSSIHGLYSHFYKFHDGSGQKPEWRKRSRKKKKKPESGAQLVPFMSQNQDKFLQNIVQYVPEFTVHTVVDAPDLSQSVESQVQATHSKTQPLSGNLIQNNALVSSQQISESPVQQVPENFTTEERWKRGFDKSRLKEEILKKPLDQLKKEMVLKLKRKAVQRTIARGARKELQNVDGPYHRPKRKKSISRKDPNVTIPCPSCPKVFTSELLYKFHERKHEKEKAKKHVCSVCGRRYQREIDLEQHMVKHKRTGNEKFPCYLCPDVYSKEEDLKLHRKTVHGIHAGRKKDGVVSDPKAKIYSCRFCGLTFFRPSMLSRHLTKHTGERPFRCEYCGETFRLKAYLRYHLLKHTGERPVKCDVCFKSFRIHSSMYKHRRIHVRRGEAAPRQKRLKQPKVPNQSSVSSSDASAMIPGHASGESVGIQPVSSQDVSTYSTPGMTALSRSQYTKFSLPQNNNKNTSNSNSPVAHIRQTSQDQANKFNLPEKGRSSFNSDGNTVHTTLATHQQATAVAKKDGQGNIVLHIPEEMHLSLDDTLIFVEEGVAEKNSSVHVTVNEPSLQQTFQNQNQQQYAETIPKAGEEYNRRAVTLQQTGIQTQQIKGMPTDPSVDVGNQDRNQGIKLPVVSQAKQGQYAHPMSTVMQSVTQNVQCLNTSDVNQKQDTISTPKQTVVQTTERTTDTEPMTYDSDDNGDADYDDPSSDPDWQPAANTPEDDPKAPDSPAVESQQIPVQTVQTIYQCELCLDKFEDIELYKKHIYKMHKLVMGVNGFEKVALKCAVCGKTFDSERGLQRHQILHTGEKPFKCEYCDESFRSRSVIRRHQYKEHGVGKPPGAQTKSKECIQYQCGVCGKVYTSQPGLTNHLTLHTGHLKLSCEYCGERFRYYGRWRTHLKNVHGVISGKPKEKKLQCPYCPLKISCKSVLKTHLRTHTGEKPYSCDECGQAFAQKAYLKRHMLGHTGGRQAQCPLCGKTYGSRESLSRHKRKHHGIRGNQRRPEHQ